MLKYTVTKECKLIIHNNGQEAQIQFENMKDLNEFLLTLLAGYGIIGR